MPGRFTETGLTQDGMDAVSFYMSANLGEALKPLSKVASGGELARIMLALKNVLAERDHVPTLIFDEVDTGVSGRAAQRVAEKLRALSRTKQVLVRNASAADRCAGGHAFPHRQGRARRPHVHERDAARL